MKKKILPYKILRPPILKSFELPTRDEILGVKLGWCVKLIFQGIGGSTERMWVQVSKKDDNDGREWIGTLDNQPLGIDGLVYRDKVVFHPGDVIDIYHIRKAKRKK